MSVIVGILNFSPTFFNIESASKSPIPVKESNLDRFAFSVTTFEYERYLKFITDC